MEGSFGGVGGWVSVGLDRSGEEACAGSRGQGTTLPTAQGRRGRYIAPKTQVGKVSPDNGKDGGD